MARVELTNLVKRYSSHLAVDHVSLTVEHGEFVALVGPSGCGKTTTLNLVAGLLEQSGGEIRIGERVVNDLDPKDRDIAMVFQNYALYPNKTVRKNLAFPLVMRKAGAAEIARKVESAAHTLDITHLLDRYPRELSGGQQQRVALGRAMVRDPAAFLMDEPLSNLDAKLRVQMRTELKRFHQEIGATVIYVTHDQLEAVTMADRMAVMQGGRLQQYASPADVFEQPVNVFVAGFVGSPAMNLLQAELRDGSTPALHAEGWSLPLSKANARLAAVSSTRAVVLGARHSAIELLLAETPNTVPGRIYTVEPTGDLTYAYVRLGLATLVVSVPPMVKLLPDQTVWLRFDQHRIHLFDSRTERNLAV